MNWIQVGIDFFLRILEWFAIRLQERERGRVEQSLTQKEKDLEDIRKAADAERSVDDDLDSVQDDPFNDSSVSGDKRSTV